MSLLTILIQKFSCFEISQKSFTLKWLKQKQNLRAQLVFSVANIQPLLLGHMIESKVVTLRLHSNPLFTSSSQLCDSINFVRW